jgi:YD repeat-containing protein
VSSLSALTTPTANVLTEISALNETRTYTYDTNGNLLSTKDAAGNNSQGLRTSMTDPLNGVTIITTIPPAT